MYIKTIEDMHKCNLELLLDFDTLCKKNNIGYFIAYGTLIGAVRHKNFIPWDDDLDVILLREEYEKLCALPESKYPEHLRLFRFSRAPPADNVDVVADLRHECVRESFQSFKYPTIDIFVFDYSPRRLKHRWLTWKVYVMAKGYRVLEKIDRMPKSVKDLARTFLERAYQRYALLPKCVNGRSLYLSNGTIPHAGLKKYNSSWFNDTTLLNIRESNFPAPIGYDKFLKSFYGDYMKLPPKEAQTAIHYSFEQDR
ncbi:MAG: LicD family protein [Methanomassiliicoccaceae archaeon]|nr:LicD family protein [Methanomassiliicoccaceae archaeon]